MKLCIFSDTCCQTLTKVNNEHKVQTFYVMRMATDVTSDTLDEEWRCYVVQISSENHQQNCSMNRVCLLLSKRHSCHRLRRTGEGNHESVQGCISNANVSVVYLGIVFKGEK